MKILNILVLISTLFFNMALLDISPKTEVDENKFINVKTSKILDGFLQNGFVIADNNDATKPYVILNQTDKSDVAVKIYTTSQLAKVNGIFILVNLNDYTENKESDKSKRPLNQETFENLKTTLANLECSNDVDFLRASFVCNNNYEITYTINSDNFDELRKFFAFSKRAELLIIIRPI